ncbi:response regulator [Paraburkholderia sp. JHI2823]|uniref:response regulator n=1 Tax=Paraburkholderia sp. JHI2823 TaxID=3112960 RepID=UPI003178C934
MATPDHVLIVDDDSEIRSLLERYLDESGYRVTAVRDGKQLRKALAEARPDLIVLDLTLPGEDGLSLFRDAGIKGRIPVIMLTARGEEVDRVLGLELGADDYVSKPFSPRELVARIRNVLRRVRQVPENLQPEFVRSYHFAGWSLDTRTRELLSPDQMVVALSGTEYRLLKLFVDHPRRVLTREQLSGLGRGRELGPLDRIIDVQVSRLRQHLNDSAKEAALIKTVRNEGYFLNADVEPEL